MGAVGEWDAGQQTRGGKMQECERGRSTGLQGESGAGGHHAELTNEEEVG